MDGANPEADRLLAELAWLRRLARRLVSDPDAAEDAVQETVLASLTRAPREPRSRRGWLATVLRNVARQDRRACARREAREREASRERVAPSTLDVVVELALHRRLVELVQELEEPYRTTLVQRFLHERSPRDIARAARVPVKTIYTRIERGLARLRARLDRESGGDRTGWIAALTPFGGPEAPAAPSLAASTLLVLSMNAKLLAVAAGLAVLGSVVVLSLESLPDQALSDPGVPLAQLAVPEAEPLTPSPELAARSPLEGSRAAVSAKPVESVEPPREGLALLIAGRVCEVDGRRVPGVRVVFEQRHEEAFARYPEPPAAVTAPDGSFELLVPARAGRLTVDSASHTSVARPYLDGAPPSEPPVVVVAPSRTYAGVVVDQDGRPIRGARVRVEPEAPAVLLAGAGSEPPRVARLPGALAEIRSDAQGAFELSLGHLPQASVVATRDGFTETRIPLPEAGSFELTLVLERAAREGPMVHGLVLDALGLPAADAHVSAGGAAASSGPDGRFTLELEPWRARVVLMAVRPGSLPAVLELGPDGESSEGLAPSDPVTLHLGAAPSSIRGRVVDRSGSAVPGASVWTPDTTYFGSVLLDAGEGTVLGETTAEAIAAGLRGRRDAGSLVVQADGTGEFVLEGLLDREYPLFALDPVSLASAGPVQLRAGSSGAELVLETREVARVAGRVLAESGEPLAHARIAVGRELAWDRKDAAGGLSWKRSPLTPPGAALAFHARPLTTTDGQGRFELGELELDGTFLLVSGRDVLLSPRVELRQAADPEQLEIRVPAFGRLQVVLSGDPDEADAIVRIAGDRPRPLFLRVEDRLLSTPRVELVAGHSGVVQTEAGPCTLALLKGGREVRRVELELVPGEIAVVQP